MEEELFHLFAVLPITDNNIAVFFVLLVWCRKESEPTIAVTMSSRYTSLLLDA